MNEYIEEVVLPELSIYPNPSTDIFHITFGSEEPAQVRLEITDLQGKVLESQDLTGELTGTHHHVLYDGTQLESGVYLYRLWIGDRVARGKLIKE